MLRNSYSLKKQNGYSLVETIIGISLISAVIVFGMNLYSDQNKSMKKHLTKSDNSILNDYIVAKTAYANSCLSSLNVSQMDLNTVGNSQTLSFSIFGPNSSLIGANTFNTFFNLLILNLEVRYLNKSKDSYGYQFFSGEFFITTKVGNVSREISLGGINFLKNPLGIVVGCSTREDLQNHQDYVSERNKH